MKKHVHSDISFLPNSDLDAFLKKHPSDNELIARAAKPENIVDIARLERLLKRVSFKKLNQSGFELMVAAIENRSRSSTRYLMDLRKKVSESEVLYLLTVSVSKNQFDIFFDLLSQLPKTYRFPVFHECVPLAFKSRNQSAITSVLQRYDVSEALERFHQHKMWDRIDEMALWVEPGQLSAFVTSVSLNTETIASMPRLKSVLDAEHLSQSISDLKQPLKPSKVRM